MLQQYICFVLEADFVKTYVSNYDLYIMGDIHLYR